MMRFAVILAASVGVFFIGGFSLARYRAGAESVGAHAVSESIAEISAQGVSEPIPVALIPTMPFVELYRHIEAASHEERAAELRAIAQIKSAPKRKTALQTYIKCLAGLNTDEAIALVRQVENPKDVDPAVVALLAGAPADSTSALVRLLLDLPGNAGESCREKYLNGQLYFWSIIDPTAVATFCDSYPVDDLSETGFIGNWAASDPDAAYAWLERHPEAAANQEIAGDFVWGLYQNDPRAAGDYLVAHADDERFVQSLGAYTRRTFRVSPGEATEWVQRLSTPEARREAIRGMAEADAEMFVAPGENVDAQFRRSADWMTQFPAEEWKDVASTLLSRWAAESRTDVLGWLKELPPPTRKAMALEYAGAVGIGGIENLATLGDQELRREILAGYIPKLGATQQERASLILSMNLPKAEADELLQLARSLP